MRAFIAFALVASLYGALSLGASPAVAADLTADQVAALKEARTGDMKKLIFHKEPRDRLEKHWQDERGAPVQVEDYEGKVVLMNFWATWCPPCRKEMPYLDQLRADMAGDDFEVIALSMDRASVEKIKTFYQSINSTNLPVHREPTLRIGTEAGVLGMPVTILLDRQGREIARLQGEAKWDGEDAKAIIRRVIQELGAEG
ncbi:MAG: TlpA disulfide reductase family protein [Pseudomonadota bacterium]